MERLEFGETGVAYLGLDGELTQAWVEGGTVGLNVDTLQQAKRMEKLYQASGQVPCTMCGERMVTVGENPRHFASIFCTGRGSCWEHYQRANNGACRRCGDPRWKCVC